MDTRSESEAESHDDGSSADDEEGAKRNVARLDEIAISVDPAGREISLRDVAKRRAARLDEIVASDESAPQANEGARCNEVPPVSPESLADGLFGALVWLEKAYEAACERVDLGLCTPKELIVLRMVCRYGEIDRAPRMTDLSKALGMNRGYVKELSQALLAEGLVNYGRHPKDRRIHSLDSTPHGEDVGRVDEIGSILWRMFVDALGAKGARDLARGLALLQRPLV